MFNSGIRGKRASDGTGTTNPQSNFIQNKYPVPTITSWSISGSDDTALNPAGGQTVLVNGGGFAAGCAVTVNGVTITPVTVISPNQISFTSTALAGGSYTLIVYNSEGGGAVLVPGLVYSSVPTYTTAQGSIGSGYETKAISTSVTATSDSSITYAVTSGALPSGASMTSGGVITGTYPTLSVGTSETFYFDITATDAENQDVTRSFTLTTNIDVVTWVTPSSGATITLDGTAYSQALSATDAAGYSVSYSANALPTGLTLSSGTISGTPTVEGTSSTLLTATAATTNRTATNTVTWVVSLSDVYFKFNTLLLSANSSIQTSSFVSDNSINNQQLTVFGDARATNFNPYQVGYYSNFFDGTGDYLTTAASTNFDMGTGDFTIECFALTNGYAGSQYGRGLFALYPSGNYNKRLIVRHTNADNRLNIYGYDGTNIYFGSSGTSGSYFLVTGTWNHIAFVRQSGVFRLYINGVQDIVVSNQTAVTLATSNCFDIGRVQEGTVPEWNGNISNFRVIKGTCLYNNGTTFTPPTTPFLPSPTIQLLTCQSNRLIDSSPTNITLTKGGDTTVSSAHPFTTVYQAGTQYYSTYFDGTGDKISIATNSAFTFGTDDFTIECWFNTSSTTASIFDLRNTIVQVTPYLYATSSTLRYYVSGADRITSSTLTLNTWYHLALVRISGVTKMYLNGQQAGSSYTDTNNYISNAVNIGAAYAASQQHTGFISNLRVVKGVGIYTGAFTPPTSTLQLTQDAGTNISAITSGQTVLLTCQDSTIKDNSTNNFTITASGDAKPVAVSPFTPSSYTNNQITTYGSAYFDGTGDSIACTNTPNMAPGTGDFTYEAWVYTSTFTYTGTTGKLYTTAVSNGLGIDVTSSGAIAVSKTAVATLLTTTTSLTLNAWNHVAVSRISGSTRVFINGVLAHTAAVSDTNDYSAYSAVFIGQENNSRYFNGYLSDVRFLKGTAHYTSNFVPQFTSPLSNVTNTQLLTLQTNGSHNNSTFKDQSSFNNVITRNGNTTNGTFSPYGDNWSTYFNGSLANQYFTLPTATATLLGGFNGNYTTIEFFVNQTQTSTAATENEIFGSAAAVAANGRFVVTIGSASATNQPSKVRFLWTTSTGTTDQVIATNTIPVNTWAHVAIVVNATGSAGSHTVTIYTNGSGETFTGKNFSSQTSTYDRLRVGGNSESYLYGYLSNLRVTRATTNTVGYSGASISVPTGPLSALPSTKLLLCQTNRFIDSSINPNTVSVLGTPTIEKFSPFSTVTVPKYYSTYFNTSGNSITYSNNAAGPTGTEDFTWEVWWYFLTQPGGSYPRVFETTTTNGFQIYFNGSTLTIGQNGGSTVLTYGITSVNEWLHLCVTRSGSAMRLFVNGVLRAYTASGGTNFATSTTGWRVLSEGGSGPHGYLSNMRVVRGSVVSDYVTSSTTTGTNIFTPPTSPLTAVANTTLLAHQSSTQIDNSTTNSTITPNATTIVIVPVSPFTTAASSVTSYSPTVFGGSMYFDGSDYISVTNSSSWSSLPGDFTIECWFYFMNTTLNQQVIFTQRSSTNPYVPYLFWTSGSTIVMYSSSNNASWNIINNSTVVSSWVPQQWNHFAFTKSGSTYRIFFNGIQTYTYTNSDSFTNTGTFNLGMSPGETNAASYGYVTDARITKGVALYTSSFYPGATPLTPTTTIGSNTYSSNLLLTGTSGGVIDATRTVDLETVADAKVTNFSPYNGSYYSYNFPNSAAYIAFAGNTSCAMGSGDFTIEFWFYADGSISGIPLVDFRPSGTATGLYPTIYIPGTLAITYYTNGADRITGATLTTGTWYHIALTRASGNTKLFLNGSQTGSTYSDSNVYVNGTSRPVLGAFGDTLSTSLYITGKISNFRIVKGTAVYTSNFTPSTTPLTAVSGTSLLTCQSNKFVDNSTNNFTITRSGDTKVATQNPFQVNSGQSYYFDGTGDYLWSPATTRFVDFGNGDWSIECWVYFNSVANAAHVWQFGANSTARANIYLSSSKLSLYSIGSTVLTGSTTLVAGQWYHVAATFIAGTTTTKLFVNGSQDGINTTYNSYPKNAADIAFMMGYQPFSGAAGDYLNGYISDLRITKGYARTITVPSAPYKTN